MNCGFDLAHMPRIASLFERMNEYRNSLLIKKFQNDLSLSAADANALFADVKRFIALSASTPESLAPPTQIDQGWHQFILLTKDYTKFCTAYCGRYIHHQPTDPFAEGKVSGCEPSRTRELAEMVFGPLSSNWNDSTTRGSCTINCGTAPCSTDIRTN